MRTVVNDETHTDKPFLIARVIVEDGASALTTGINYRTIIIREGDRVRNPGRSNFQIFLLFSGHEMRSSTNQKIFFHKHQFDWSTFSQSEWT